MVGMMLLNCLVMTVLRIPVSHDNGIATIARELDYRQPEVFFIQFFRSISTSSLWITFCSNGVKEGNDLIM